MICEVRKTTHSNSDQKLPKELGRIERRPEGGLWQTDAAAARQTVSPLNPRFPLPTTTQLWIAKSVQRLSESLASSSALRLPSSPKKLKARDCVNLLGNNFVHQTFPFLYSRRRFEESEWREGEGRLISNSIHPGTFECHQFCDLISYNADQRMWS